MLPQNPPQGVVDFHWSWDPKTAPYGRFHHFNPYIAFLFTAGLEVCQHYRTYARYAGDEAFLMDRAYPIIHDVCHFVTSLMQKEEDGRFHLDPANAPETWWPGMLAGSIVIVTAVGTAMTTAVSRTVCRSLPFWTPPA